MLNPEHDALADWYRRLYGEVEDGWLSFFSVDRRTGENQVRWCRATDIDAATAITRELNAHGDVWNGVAIRTHRTSGRGGSDVCGWITALWSDIDFVDAGHAGNSLLPPDEKAAADLVRDFPVKPTAVIHSGGGLQAWHMLDEPAHVDELGDLLEAYGTTWNKVGKDAGYHVDNVFDLARIMRAPGTTNRKLDTPRPVRLIFADWTRRYGISELRDQLEDPPEPETYASDRLARDVPYIGPDRPGDEYMARHDGHELLTAYGFHSPDRDPYGNIHYRAPHRGVKEGTGATVYAEDGHVTIWSETFCARHPNLKAQHGYDVYGLYVALEHGGDFSAASSALRAKGYGAPLKPAVDLGVTEPPAQVDPETGEVLEETDDAPMALDLGADDLPDFPMHVLPDWIADEAKAAADAIQVPVEITAFLGLMTLSIAVAGKVEVEAYNWRQPLNLYGTVVAPTGTGKSPAAERMLLPLRELEAQMVDATSAAVAYSEAEATSHANAVADAEKALKNDPGATILIAQLADARQSANEHRVLSPYRMTVDDHTPEALAQTIASQVDERIAVVSPEGAALFESMTGKRYRDASAAPNVPDVYLKSWSAEQISVDRVGRPALVIKRPVLTVCVMVQPDVIHALAATPSIARQGGLARFLWVHARDIVGTRDRKRRRHAAPQSEEYRARMLQLGLWAAKADRGAIVYQTTEEAADVIDDLANEREARMGFGGDLEAHRAIEAKMLAYHWRLAALLAVAHGDRDELSAHRARQATELVDYFMAHAVAVHGAAGLSEGDDGTWRRMARWMMDHAGETVEPRTIWLGMRSTYPKVTDLVPDLERLQVMRWVRIEGETSTIGVRKAASPTLHIHPDIAR